ncbi:SGNH/GDSL hydrolase family protein [Acinetobacter junii]|uniref:SGNH/GDSL hydrolase family protein n=1 Tax=Acinetobacter junii TaxID=40215 RepID=UPI0030160D17
MWLKISTLFLLPVIVAQGIVVKQRTPKLLEPIGERQGIVGFGRPLSLLILGDSAAAGVGVEYQHQALSGVLISQLMNEYQLTWALHAKTGDNTRQVIDAINALESQVYDVIVTSIGVNDVTKLTSTRLWIKQQKQLFTELRKKFDPKLIIVTGVPPMQHFPALPHPLAWIFGKHAQQMNKKLQGYLSTELIFKFIEFDLEHFKEMNLPMAIDGFHPSKEIYEIWGKQVASLVREFFTS